MDKKSSSEYLWNFKDLYSSIDSPNLKKDLEHLEVITMKFNQDYSGQKISHKFLHEAIVEFEKISELHAKIASFAYLIYSTNLLDEKITNFFQNTSEKLVEIEKNLIFFILALRNIKPAELTEFCKKNPNLNHYLPYINNILIFAKHQLSEDLEKTLLEYENVARDSWVRLFNETLSHMKFSMNEQEYSLTEIQNLTTDYDADTRKKAHQTIGHNLKDQIHSFTLITNTLSNYKQITDQKRNFDFCDSSTHMQNLIEPHVVSLMNDTIITNYKNTSHKYYKYKAKKFGKKHLDYWDRNAPYPDDLSAQDYIDFNNAQDLVLSAYYEFSNPMGEIAEQFFTNNWIDVFPRSGKDSGAYSHPTVPSSHPYILLNYQGKIRDIMTLAHELGHGIHQYLARKQGFFLADTPTNLAETASIFGEKIIFKKMLNLLKDKERKRIMICNKVEDMINTVIRQISFYNFEKEIHNKRRKDGSLTTQDINNIWSETQKKSLGKYVILDEYSQYYWSYIPHFIESPFYTYSYAFGECLVTSLYECYEQGFPDFKKHYLNLLSSGGRYNYKDLLAKFNLNPEKQSFWQQGMNHISNYIQMLENDEY